MKRKPKKTPKKHFKVNQEKQRKETISLKVKLIISHILIAILPILLISIILTSQAQTSLIEKVNSSNLAYVSKVTKILDAKIKSIEDVSRIILADNDLNYTVNKDPSSYANSFEMVNDRRTNIDNKIESLLFSNSMIKSILIIKEDEIFGIFQLGEKKFYEDFYNTEVYKKVEESRTGAVWFYNLYGTDDLYVIRNLNSGNSKSVLVIQVKKDLFLEDLKSDFGDLAKLVLLDASGQIVISPKDQADMGEIKYFDQIKAQMDASAQNKEPLIGTFTTKSGLDDEASILYGSCTNNWIYLLQIPISEFLGDVEKIKAAAFALTVIATILAVLVGVWIALSISRPIDYIRKKLKLVEQGDITVESKYTGKHEIGQLSNSFNHMTLNMRNLLQELRMVADRVSINSGELNEIAQNSANTTKEVMLAVESVSDGATEQAMDAENTAVVIKELVTQVNATEQHFSFVVDATNKTRKSSQDAKGTLETLNTTTGDTINLSQHIQEDIKRLVGRFNEISSIIDMISSISGQTNLLALNAAIEAARAGESGKGFAVVADEVRKLAVQSSDAVKSISTIINSIYLDTTKTEKMIEEGSTIYKKQEEAVNNTETIFNEIVENMDAIISEVNMVYGLLEGLDGVQNKATDSITSIAAIAQESAAAIEEILANGQEQMNAADQLVNMSLELGHIISDMENQMSQFQIEKK